MDRSPKVATPLAACWVGVPPSVPPLGLLAIATVTFVVLPGAMMRNAGLRFVCKWVDLRVENPRTPFTTRCRAGEVLRLPIAHGEGNYVSLSRPEWVVLRYCDADGNLTDAANPNGSQDCIAGVTNPHGNVFGLMPHPDRASDARLGSADGAKIFQSMMETIVASRPISAPERVAQVA